MEQRRGSEDAVASHTARGGDLPATGEAEPATTARTETVAHRDGSARTGLALDRGDDAARHPEVVEG